jgi:hypothetical protein
MPRLKIPTALFWLLIREIFNCHKGQYIIVTYLTTGAANIIWTDLLACQHNLYWTLFRMYNISGAKYFICPGVQEHRLIGVDL